MAFMPRAPDRNDPRLTDREVLVQRVKLVHEVLGLALQASMPGRVRPPLQAAHTRRGGVLRHLQGDGAEAERS